MDEEKKCVNCQVTVTELYCPACGQKQTVKRLTFREGWNDFWARIYGFDGMFPRTLRDLTIRPGIASRRFIEGNRVAYYGPVGYFFLMITLLYLVASLLEIDLVEFLKGSADLGMQAPPPKGSNQEQFMQAAMRYVSDNLKLVSFIMIPMQAFFARYVFFRKSGLNFIENMVLPFYVLGHMYWLSISSLITYSLTGNFISPWVQTIIGLTYFSFAYANHFQYQSKLKAFFKGLGVYIGTQFMFGILVAIVVVMLIVMNPSVFEMLRPSNNP